MGLQGLRRLRLRRRHRHLRRPQLHATINPRPRHSQLQRGMDNECADFFAKRTDDQDYRPYLDAVKQGLLQESDHRHRRHASLHRAHQARHVRPAGDGALHQNRRERTRQRRASRSRPQTGRRVHGAAQERRHAAAQRPQASRSPSSARSPTRPASCSATTTASPRTPSPSSTA